MGGIAEIITDAKDDEFRVLGLKFRYVNAPQAYSSNQRRTDHHPETPAMLKQYEPYFKTAPTKNALEVGVFEGGSIILFALAYPDFKFVGSTCARPTNACCGTFLILG